LDAARALGRQDCRAYALGSLAKHLSSEQRSDVLSEALASAIRSIDGIFPAHALKWLAPQLSRQQIDRATSGNKPEWLYDRILNSLAAHLSQKQVTQALEAAKASRDDWFRAQVLASIAQHLSLEQSDEAIAITGAISDKVHRAYSLGSLARCLSPQQLNSA